ncbi:hypothetical protein ACOSQ2_002036 [Xanthoceras sorbifolium]
MTIKIFCLINKQTDHHSIQTYKRTKIIKDDLHYNQHTSELNKQLSPNSSNLAVHSSTCTFHTKTNTIAIKTSTIYTTKKKSNSQNDLKVAPVSDVDAVDRKKGQTKSIPY